MHITQLYKKLLLQGDFYYGLLCGQYSFEKLFKGGYSETFIINLLTRGEKSKCPIVQDLFSLDEDRKRHVVSCYLFGLVLYENMSCFRSIINEFIRKNFCLSNENAEQRFYYMWLICCLFHDLGYMYEYGDKNASKTILKTLPQRPTGIPKVYTKKLFDKYWDFKKCRFAQLDHGLCGGAIYYEQMCELRQIKEKEHSDNFCWGVDMEKVYAHIAWVIACHNIFFQKESLCYECKGLDKLIIYEENDGHIRFDEHPFLYFFCLIDTLEPMKVVELASKLNQIRLLFNHNHLEIDISKLCLSLRDDYESKYNSMNKWLVNYKQYVSLKK